MFTMYAQIVHILREVHVCLNIRYLVEKTNRHHITYSTVFVDVGVARTSFGNIKRCCCLEWTKLWKNMHTDYKGFHQMFHRLITREKIPHMAHWEKYLQNLISN